MISNKTIAIASLGLFFAICEPGNSFAQKIRLPFRTTGELKQQPPEAFTLQESDGPWLIMCASFVGEEGEHQARDLASELRNEHGLKAILYSHHFERAESLGGIGYEVQEINGKNELRPKRMKLNSPAQLEEIAVLVGDFPTIDDARAQKTLETIKQMQPKALADFSPKRGTSQSLRLWRAFADYQSGNPEDRNKGPLRSAFMLLNPLLPQEYFQANKVDHFILKLNKGIKFSLLNCPAPYSVRVATFGGHSTFKLNEIAQEEEKQNWLRRKGQPIRESKLVEAAEKAHLLTTELRKCGLEAYEFHDRFESYVCVGSFDWVSRGREANPKVAEIVNAFKATIQDLPNFPNSIIPQELPSLKGKGIFFDAQPVPVLVPQRQVATLTSGNSQLK